MTRQRLLGLLQGVIVATALGLAGLEMGSGAPATGPAEADAGYTAPPLPAADPMEFHESKVMPHIDDPLTDAEYERRVAAIHPAPALSVAQARERHVTSVVVVAVEHGGGAEQAGVKLGDTLVAMDGEPLVYHWQVRAAQREHVDTSFAVASPGELPRHVKLMAREFGMDPETRWDGAVAWDRIADHDPRFDSFVRVAAMAYRSDPALAWSALARAQKAGCDGHVGGYIPPALAALTAYGQARFDDFLAFASIARHDMPAAEAAFFTQRMRLGALASFRLPLALDLFKELGPDLQIPEPARDTAIANAIAAWQRVPDRAVANPLSQIADYDFRDVTAEAAPLLDPAKDPQSQWVAERVRKQRKFSVDVVAGHFVAGTLAPAGKEIDASVEFSFKPYEDKKTMFGHTFSVGLSTRRGENDPGTWGSKRLLRFSLFDNDLVMVSRYANDDYSFWQSHSADGHHRARIVAIGQRCEVILDGRRILYCPLVEDEKNRVLALSLQMVGIKAVVHHCSVKVADGKKEK